MKQQSENWKRELWIGDNLAIMRQMNSETVDLIYLDPPFNSKRMYEGNLDEGMGKQSFSDIWGDSDITEDDRRILRERNPLLAELISFLGHSHGISWQSYLSFMGIRLMEMHRLLKDTGSIYLHCDPTMSHPLKLLMDMIFGAKSNFRNEIVWHHPKIGVANHQFTSNNDTLLFYSKSDKYYFSPITTGEPNELATRWKNKLDGMQLLYRQAKGIADSPAKSKIRVRQKELNRPLRDDDVVVDFTAPENQKRLDNVWRIPFLRGNSKESTGWATQKPIALLERIINASSKNGDVVLDPFCGCGTACVAATNLGRQWIGIDQHPKAGLIMQDRMKKDAKLAPEWDGVKILLEKDAAKLPKRTDVVPFRKDERTKRTLYERQKGKCASGELCLNGTDAKPINFMQFDRKLSATRGGGYTWDNVQLLCSTCNISKGKKTWKVFIDGLKREKAQQYLKELNSPEEE